MVSCAHRSCHSRDAVEKKKSTGITFHRFPKDPARRQIWLQFINRGAWKPTKYSVLCSKHFSEMYIDRTSKCYVRLRENAIPTLSPSQKPTMDYISTPVSFHLIPELKAEPKTENNEIETFLPVYCNSLDESYTPNLQKPIVKNDEDILDQISLSNNGNKKESFLIVPRCIQVYGNEEMPMVKIEKSEAVNAFVEKMYDEKLGFLKVKSEELDIKEDDLECSETRCNQVYGNEEMPMVKSEKSEAVNEFVEKMYDEKLGFLKVKSEELDIKEDDLECSETSYTKPPTKAKNKYVVNHPEQIYDGNYEDWKTSNEEMHVKEEDLKTS